MAFYFSRGMEYPALPGHVAIKESGARARGRERGEERGCEMHQRDERSAQPECNWITAAAGQVCQALGILTVQYTSLDDRTISVCVRTHMYIRVYYFDIVHVTCAPG